MRKEKMTDAPNLDMTLPDLPEGWRYSLLCGPNPEVFPCKKDWCVVLRNGHDDVVAIGVSLRQAAMNAIAQIGDDENDKTD